MNRSLRARFVTAKASLLLAELLSRRVSGKTSPRVRPVGPATLPQHDGNRGRAAAVEEAKRHYAIGPAHEIFKMPFDMKHDTLRALPAWEEYPPLIKLPKMFLLLGFSIPLVTDDRWTSLDEAREAYSILGSPAIVERWQDDAEFARQRLQGPNPIWLRRARDIDELVKLGLTRENVTLAGLEAHDAEGLYYVDYQPYLAGIERSATGVLHPCLALFHNKNGQLMPIGIQLTLDAGQRVFYRADGSPAWSLAKMFFQSMDVWMHEVLTHYLYTHVYGEKFILATARHLSWSHPVRRLLAPHFENTLKLNQFGANELIAVGKVFDTEFTAGITGKKLAIETGNSLWRFDHMRLPEQIASRGLFGVNGAGGASGLAGPGGSNGVTGAKGIGEYPYRDDGLLHWHALDEYVGDYLRLYYRSSADLAEDHEIQAWHRELHAGLGERGFPALAGLDELRSMLVAAIFNVVQHEFVNAPQYEYFGFALSSPTMLMRPMPADPSSVTEQTILDTMPGVNHSLRSLLLSYGFSKQYNRLGSHAPFMTEGPARTLAMRYAARLREIEATVIARNAQRVVPYLVSLPSRMSNSISA